MADQPAQLICPDCGRAGAPRRCDALGSAVFGECAHCAVGSPIEQWFRPLGGLAGPERIELFAYRLLAPRLQVLIEAELRAAGDTAPADLVSLQHQLVDLQRHGGA